MMRAAVEMARKILERSGEHSFPLDMERLAEQEGCEVIEWPLLPPVWEVKQGRWIGIARNLTSHSRRYLVAHALAHHFLHTGNQLWFHDEQRVTIARQERQADECAAHILMPEEEIAKFDNSGSSEIAEHFGVHEAFVERRLTEFATDTEIIRWEHLRESEGWNG